MDHHSYCRRRYAFLYTIAVSSYSEHTKKNRKKNNSYNVLFAISVSHVCHSFILVHLEETEKRWNRNKDTKRNRRIKLLLSALLLVPSYIKMRKRENENEKDK